MFELLACNLSQMLVDNNGYSGKGTVAARAASTKPNLNQGTHKRQATGKNRNNTMRLFGPQ
jgi:hypothetical protein